MHRLLPVLTLCLLITSAVANGQSNSRPSVYAGPDQTVSLPGPVILSGSETNSISTGWSKLSGPGLVTFANATAIETSATFSEPGIYTLMLAGWNGSLYLDEVLITVNADKPVVYAGPDQAIVLPAALTLNGVSHGTPSIGWSKVSGPGAVTFAAANSATTTATFTEPGTYMLMLAGWNGALYLDEVSITVNAAKLAVYAGPDQAAELPGPVTLNGIVTGTNSIGWSMVSGPGVVTFADTHAAVTTATFSKAGAYTLMLAGWDGTLKLDEVIVTIQPGINSAIDNALAAITDAVGENKIVASAIINGGQRILTYTDQTQLSIEDNLIASVSENLSAWELLIEFSDGRTGKLFLLGTSIGIKAENILLNPNDATPLAAFASFITPAPGHIRIVVPGIGSNGITVEKSFALLSTQFSLPILGLYEDHDNQVEFHFSDASGNELTTDIVEVSTSALDNKPTIDIVINNLPADEDKVYMEIGNKYAFDQTGAIRWAYTGTDVYQMFDRLPGGNWLVTGNSERVVYHWRYFSEIDMAGFTVQSFEAPNLGHHDVSRMANGNYLIAGNSVPMLSSGFGDVGTPQEDAIFELSAGTGQITNAYYFDQILDPLREDLPSNTITDDWFHINAVYEDVADDSLVVSGRHQSAVVKIRRGSGDLVWILGAHEGWGAEFEPYLLTPVDANGEPLEISAINFWPYAQHAPVKLPNGNIMIYDNGTDRGHYKEVPKPENAYSRAVEYKIDEQNMTIELVWEFDYMQQIFTIATGDVDYLPDTNGRLISFMWVSSLALPTPRIVELDEFGNVVFEVILNEGAAANYRAEKFALYEGIQ